MCQFGRSVFKPFDTGGAFGFARQRNEFGLMSQLLLQLKRKVIPLILLLASK
jgi:hypothetical protein